MVRPGRGGNVKQCTSPTNRNEQRLARGTHNKPGIIHKESERVRLAVDKSYPTLRLNGEELRIMADGRTISSGAPEARQRSGVATAKPRTTSYKKSLALRSTTVEEHGRLDARTQTDSVAQQDDRCLTFQKAERNPKPPFPNFADLSKDAWEQHIADVAAWQNAAQAVLDRKYERFQRTYTEPLQPFRETRQKAAEAMVQAAKAEAVQGSVEDTALHKSKVVERKCASGRLSEVGHMREHDHRSVIYHRSELRPSRMAFQETAKDTEPSKIVNSNVEFSVAPNRSTEAKETCPVVPSLIISKSDMDSFERNPAQSLSCSGVLAKESEAEQIARLVARIGLTRRSAMKAASTPIANARAGTIDKPNEELSPTRQSPTTQWGRSDLTDDPDSLFLRYYQLESTKDRDGSRRLFKAKQEKLRKQRERNWWEVDEGTVPEDDWQRFARERHPGPGASAKELHQYYRMVHETVPLPERNNIMIKYAGIKYNKKRTPAMPVSDDGSTAQASTHGTAVEQSALIVVDSSLKKNTVNGACLRRLPQSQFCVLAHATTT
ncbi:hypothetical protein DOTSEDRAFT_34942 [Dothistroma septosporum NZE10]|uniref:Uncharacterized protein n=1 Tax=Dothistroma septosporum (strain NZE10 / CBS 128990) TaxID=675120 RepID=N1PNN4_DOTSN|nr:hypothetical protein DOTSEDRAFT_34942 [Dothistroma septosporum NZE10]